MISTNELGTVSGSHRLRQRRQEDRHRRPGRTSTTRPASRSGSPSTPGCSAPTSPSCRCATPRSPDDGLTVPYSKDQVKDAPNVDPDDGHLDESEEQRLFSHYDLTSVRAATPGPTPPRQAPTGYDATATRRRAAWGTTRPDPTTDEAMTRSEEQLQVGTETREAGRARLRKYVVTEQQNVTVPVTREEVRIEREPITDANRGAAMVGPDISEEEHEVMLHEEQPVVDKQAVPVERVRLDKEQVTEQETVSEQVRQERIEADGDGVTDRS